jgi:hypothetical protein
LLQALMKCRDADLKFYIVRGCGQEHTDKAHPLPLLRARGERPDSRRTAQSTEKFPPPHSLRPKSQDKAS